MSWEIREGDALKRLREMPAGSVQTCVTSPPYWGLRDYSAEGQLGLEPTPEEYVANLVAVFREVRRVLRDDGTLWLVLGDSYWNHSPVRKASSEAFEETFTGGLIERWTDCTSPRQWSCDVEAEGLGWHPLARRLRPAGGRLVSALGHHLVEAQPNARVGHRPPDKAHEYLFLLAKRPRYYYDADAIREEPSESSGGYSLVRVAGGKVEPVSWTTNGETVKALTDPSSLAYRTVDRRDAGEIQTPDGGRNKRSVWTVATQPFPGAHFATFPPKLIEPCILAGSPPKCCGECGAPWERVVESAGQPPEPEHRQPRKRLEPGQAGNVGAGDMGFRASRLSGKEMNAWKSEIQTGPSVGAPPAPTRTTPAAP